MKSKFLKVLCIFAAITMSIISFTACGNTENGGNTENSGNSGSHGATHKHAYEWKFDETTHWWECACGDIAEDGQKTEHTNNEKMCTVCGRYIPPEALNITQDGLIYSWSTEYNGYEVGGVDDKSSELTQVAIPSEINGYPVTSIGRYAFRWCSSLTSITIPNSVIYIMYGAFEGCSSLTSITIPDSVRYIGGEAFYCCSSLTSVTIPDSVTSIGGYAFADCSSLKYNEYDNAKYLGNETNPYVALIKVKTADITACTIHKNTKLIGDCAFYGCLSLMSITIPNSVTSIGESTFYACSLTSITIPDSVTSIGGGAFKYCSSLTSITIPDSVTSIGGGAFYGCSSLTSITIPDSVTSIGGGAFKSCSSLTSITIPDSVTSIGSYAFEYCSSLTIYCEAVTQPSGWSSEWNSSDRPVIWGYRG